MKDIKLDEIFIANLCKSCVSKSQLNFLNHLFIRKKLKLLFNAIGGNWCMKQINDNLLPTMNKTSAKKYKRKRIKFNEIYK